MRWIADSRTATKLLASALVTTALLVTVGVVGIRNNARLAESLGRLQSEELRGIASLKEASLALSYMNGELSKAMLESDPDMIAFHGESIVAFDGSLQTQFARADSSVRDSISRTRLDEVTAGYPAYRELADRAIALQGEGNAEEARGVALEASAVGQALIDLMAEAATAKEVLGQEAFAAGVAIQRSARNTLILLVALGAALTLGVGLVVGRLVSRPLERTVSVLERVAQGDLSQQVTVTSRDEIGRMGEALNVAIAAQRETLAKARQMGDEATAAAEREQRQAEALRVQVAALLEVVSAAAEGDLTRAVPPGGDDAIGRVSAALGTLLEDLRGSIGEIAVSVSQLSRASESLAAVSEEMSATAEETAAQARTVASTSGTVRTRVGEIGDGAATVSARASDIATSASEAAAAAGSAVTVASRASATIAELEASSQQVGKVMDVIRSIAQQTHLLALNAAVEAARAGSAGAGFAVVAGEVKSLASRTTEATGEITQVVGGIQAQAAEAARAIAAIGEAIARVDALQGAIADAVSSHTGTVEAMRRSIEGATDATGQIVTGIDGVAVAARGTSDGADQVQQNAVQLAELATRLETLVGRFRVEGGDGEVEAIFGASAAADHDADAPTDREAHAAWAA